MAIPKTPKTKKPSKTPAAVKTDEFASILDDLQTSVKTMQKILATAVTNDEIGLSAFARVSKMIADTLDRIYKIKYGKAAQEETMMMIGELQRHIVKVEEHNAERERRSRSAPLIQVVAQMASEDDLAPDPGSDLPEESSIDEGSREAAEEAALRRHIEEVGE